MEFLKQKWGYLLVLALLLIGGGVVWILLFCRVPENYAGGLLVKGADKAGNLLMQEADMAKGLVPWGRNMAKEMW